MDRPAWKIITLIDKTPALSNMGDRRMSAMVRWAAARAPIERNLFNILLVVVLGLTTQSGGVQILIVLSPPRDPCSSF